MGKFKVGDKVRVIRASDELYAGDWVDYDKRNGINVGDTGTVSSVDDFYAYVDFSSRHSWCMNFEQLEPIMEFKVGDRVVHKAIGAGIIVKDDKASVPFLVKFDSPGFDLHNDFGSYSENRYWWCCATDLTHENTTNTPKHTDRAPIAGRFGGESAATDRKFKVGDRVETRAVTDAGVGVITSDSGNGYYCVRFDTWYGQCSELENSLRLVSPVTPDRQSIVALIENGKPRPNKTPYVHATTDAATKEAERLACKYPGQKFGVYQLVTARVGTVSVTEA